MIKPEILAPAGGPDSVEAAVRCGADAVYIGGKSFNARRNASNFGGDEIADVIRYCHGADVKVYITLNTLVTDRELASACEEIKRVCEAGADGIIVQDTGIARLIKKICPDIPLHASTQMTVNSAFGINLLGESGFSRTVIPREASREEIENISANTDIELECFVHGALCMCLSGQCLMSSILGGRSGNRGLCAQPCRLPFGVNGRGGNNLSLKDLSLIDSLDELARAGVISFKIEGRMKRPEYVAATVTACRNRLSGTPDKSVTDALGSVFSRSGFTRGYYDSKLSKDMFGIRTKENVLDSGAVLGTLSHLYDSEKPLLPVRMFFTLREGEYPLLRAEYKEYKAEIRGGEMPSKAVNRELTDGEAVSRLSKCGGTHFYAESVECEIAPGLYMSASALNSLRRDALAALEEALIAREPYNIYDCDLSFAPHRAAEKRKLHIRFFDYNEIPEGVKADRVIIPLNTPASIVKSLLKDCGEVAAEIPVHVFSSADKYIEELKRLRPLGVNLAVAGNIDGIGIAKSLGMPFATGFGMNILNSVSLGVMRDAGARDCLVSAELKLPDIAALGGEIPRGAVVYGRLPLMVTRNCPVKNKITCSACGRQSYLEDRLGKKFPVRCSDGFSYIFNSVPLCMTDKPGDIRNTDYDLIYFTTENKNEAEFIIGDYLGERAPAYEYTRGLYYRNIL